MSTGDTTTSTPAGWYTDPSDGTRSRQWDGTAWTDLVRPGRTASGRPALTDGFFRLGTTVQVLLVVTGVASGLTGIVSVWAYQLLSGWADDPSRVDEDLAGRLDVLVALLSLARYGLFAATGIAFVTWQYRAYCSDRVDPRMLRRGSGWAVAGWVVPVVSFWFPRRSMLDLWRGSRATRGLPPDDLPYTRFDTWWGTWLTMTVLGYLSDRVAQRPETLGTVSTVRALAVSEALSAAAGIAAVVAAALAVGVVRGITETLRRPVTSSPLPALDTTGQHG
ncbi:DUF4328 domain-containing protein [Phycicoccus sp. CSK15P-2]|uniref:DUF4328 domain-containing protein n=1 Tax=Phycicoccus sp. CSK15P-2 TaxID=2807627 RepID=UPI00194F6877|nr:DUF4328 domain-containing protein [Phycicoccus sp. CSK15P-2]MBM6403414.1 DUF4328 domain-containing protein [Phycicoccus sp. CSK15P-2]